MCQSSLPAHYDHTHLYERSAHNFEGWCYPHKVSATLVADGAANANVPTSAADRVTSQSLTCYAAL